MADQGNQSDVMPTHKELARVWDALAGSGATELSASRIGTTVDQLVEAGKIPAEKAQMTKTLAVYGSDILEGRQTVQTVRGFTPEALDERNFSGSNIAAHRAQQQPMVTPRSLSRVESDIPAEFQEVINKSIKTRAGARLLLSLSTAARERDEPGIKQFIKEGGPGVKRENVDPSGVERNLVQSLLRNVRKYGDDHPRTQEALQKLRDFRERFGGREALVEPGRPRTLMEAAVDTSRLTAGGDKKPESRPSRASVGRAKEVQRAEARALGPSSLAPPDSPSYTGVDPSNPKAVVLVRGKRTERGTRSVFRVLRDLLPSNAERILTPGQAATRDETKAARIERYLRERANPLWMEGRYAGARQANAPGEETRGSAIARTIDMFRAGLRKSRSEKGRMVREMRSPASLDIITERVAELGPRAKKLLRAIRDLATGGATARQRRALASAMRKDIAAKKAEDAAPTQVQAVEGRAVPIQINRAALEQRAAEEASAKKAKSGRDLAMQLIDRLRAPRARRAGTSPTRGQQAVSREIGEVMGERGDIAARLRAGANLGIPAAGAPERGVGELGEGKSASQIQAENAALESALDRKLGAAEARALRARLAEGQPMPDAIRKYLERKAAAEAAANIPRPAPRVRNLRSLGARVSGKLRGKK